MLAQVRTQQVADFCQLGHLHIGMHGVQGGDGGNHELHCQRIGGGDLDLAFQTPVGALGLAHQIVGELLHLLGGTPHAFTRRRQRVAGGTAKEKRGAQAVLEHRNPSPDGGLIHACDARSAAQRAFPLQREKHPRIVPVHCIFPAISLTGVQRITACEKARADYPARA